MSGHKGLCRACRRREARGREFFPAPCARCRPEDAVPAWRKARQRHSVPVRYMPPLAAPHVALRGGVCEAAPQAWRATCEQGERPRCCGVMPRWHRAEDVLGGRRGVATAQPARIGRVRLAALALALGGGLR